MIIIGILLALGQLCYSQSASGSGSWSTSQSGSFNYNHYNSGGDSVYVSGVVGQSGEFYGSGSAHSSGSDGVYKYNSICISGYSYSGSWYGNGQIGYNSLTVGGSAPTQSHSEGMYGIQSSGALTVDNNTLSISSGYGYSYPAFCGSYSSSYYSGSSGSNNFNVNGYASGYDDATNMQNSYSFSISDYGTGASGYISVSQTAAPGTATYGSGHASGCFTSVSADGYGMFSASGHLNGTTFQANGNYKSGFWQATSVMSNPAYGAPVIGGSYYPSTPDCNSGSSSASGGSGCAGSLNAQLPGSGYQYLSGSFNADGTWSASINANPPFPQPTFNGSYGSGMFSGNGNTLGLSWTTFGSYGMNCFHTSTQSAYCAGSGGITGLPSGYYTGCGTIHSGSFHGSGNDGSNYWSIMGTVTQSNTSGIQTTLVNGTFTDSSGTSSSFQTSSDPASGQMSITLGGKEHSVSVFRFGEAWVLAGQSSGSAP